MLEDLQHRGLSSGFLLQLLLTISEPEHFSLGSGAWNVCQQFEGCFCVSAAALLVPFPGSEAMTFHLPLGAAPQELEGMSPCLLQPMRTDG